MAELGRYTKAMEKARSITGIIDPSRANAHLRRKRWLAAKKRALEVLRQTDRRCSHEARERRSRWIAAKRCAIRVLNDHQ